jgi:hypothetical protein
MASTDPVALDYWAAKHVLMQTAKLIGYKDTDIHTINPDDTDKTGVDAEAFGVWLTRTEKEIVDGGYTVTSDENKMNVHVKSETYPPTPTPAHSPSSSPSASPLPTSSPSPAPETSPTTMYIAAGIIGVVAAAAVATILLKKRKVHQKAHLA